MKLVLDPEAEVDRHLVVARAGGVQAAGVGADQFGQPRLDIHMDVLQLAGEGELAVLDLLQDHRQASGDPLLVGLGNDALSGEHFGMRDGALDVLPVELAVEIDRGVDRLHDRGGT